jgi:addiction module HigA family antidote
MDSLRDERELLSKPGDVIVETLEHLKMNQAELAKRTGKTPSKINDLISGKEPITVNTALQLEKVLGIEAQFWLNREALYREKLSRIEQEEFLEACRGWVEQQPIKELKKGGYIQSDRIGPDMALEFLRFYGVDTPVQWQTLYVEEYTNTSFRKSAAHSSALGSMAAWMRVGELALRRMTLPPYDKEQFKAALKEILQLVRTHPEDFAEQLQGRCALAGVAIVYTPNFPKAPISGATRWVSGHPLIQLTDRYKTNDQFWFTFFHEAGHVLLHGKKEVFIEGFEGAESDKVKEGEANEFAANMLLTPKFMDDLQGEPITEKVVREIARKYETHPAIVVGRLFKLGKVLPSFGADMKLKVVFDPNIHHKNK